MENALADHQWNDWIGRSETRGDTLHPGPARALNATLGGSESIPFNPGDALPHLWSWLYFLDPARKADIGADGHPKRGGFLPPVANPRRMWAGSRCTLHGPLRLDRPARKTSKILSVTEKQARSGLITFVTVAHEVESDGMLAFREEQDIVYMDIPEVFSPPPAQPLPDCAHSEAVDIDPVLLFRFSALTFNGHRIHYDRPYAMEVENYPGLVVHGPLQAIMLFDYGTRLFPDRVASAFRFRGVRPLFDFDQTRLNARQNDTGGLDLFTANAEGTISMTATLEWAS